MPPISIIVPIYKAEKYLHQCIRSIIAQTFTDWELVLVDDGSPDKSGMICDEYARKDSRIQVIHKPNGGVSSARNKGIDKASGKWITFIDADDYILPNFIMGLYKPILDGNNVDFVHGGCCNVKKGEVVSVNQQYEAYIGDNPGYLFNKFRGLTISKLFKLNNINQWNGGCPLRFDINMKIAEDMAFTMDYLLFVKKYAFVEENGYCYRVDNVNSATKMHKVEYNFRLYEFYHLYNSTIAFISCRQLSKNESIQRKKQLGILLFNTILDLYRIGYSMNERLKHIKNDYTDDQFQLLNYVQKSKIKQLLAYLLKNKDYLLFDFLTNLAIKIH